MILTLMRFHPWSEVPEFAVVSAVRHPHLWTNENDFAIVDDYATVIDDIPVHDRPAWNFPVMFSIEYPITYIPISQTIPWASSEVRILPSTSHEWRQVSPTTVVQQRSDFSV